MPCKTLLTASPLLQCFFSRRTCTFINFSSFEASHILPCRHLFPVKTYPALKVGRCLNFSTSTAADSYSPNTPNTDVCYFCSSSFFFLNSHRQHQSRCRSGEHFPRWRRLNQSRRYHPEMYLKQSGYSNLFSIHYAFHLTMN